MKALVAEAWVEAPLHAFVRDARARFAVVLRPDGQVVGQYGFTRSLDVMAACALAAAIHGSASALGRELGGAPFRHLYHAGAARQVFLGEARTGADVVLVLCVFDADSSFGLVRMYFEAFRTAVLGAAQRPVSAVPRLGADLERDLDRSLAILFGRAPQAPPAPGRHHPTPVS